MHTIKFAAQLTRLPIATLRLWEQRYAVVTPRRTASGYRLYTDEEIQLLCAMKELVALGWAPRQAAQEVKRRAADGVEAGEANAAPDPDATSLARRLDAVTQGGAQGVAGLDAGAAGLNDRFDAQPLP